MSSTTFTIVVTSSPSTSITFTPSGAQLVAPVPQNTLVGSVVVQPSNWSGVITISGADAAFFSMSGLNVVTAQQLTEVRSYTATLTASP